MVVKYLSITSRSSVETVERTELGFGRGACFQLSYTVLKGHLGILKNKGTSMWNYFLNTGLKISPRHIDRRNVLST